MKRTRTLGLMGLVMAGVMAVPTGALAKDGDIIRRGGCTAASDWKVKLSREDGKIEAEFEVDQNRSGDRWNVVMRNDGHAFFSGERTTRGPSGSFTARDLTRNGKGSDRITAWARNLRTGEVCRGAATF